MSGCLSDDTIAGYVDGALAIAEVASVDRHIDVCTTCRGQLSAVAASPILHSFVDEPGASPSRSPTLPGSGSQATPVHTGDPAPGDALGRYVVDAVIGRGGMGVVVRAHDPELDRAVAIKLVDPAMADGRRAPGAWRARLRAEARAMARLRHPNVVAVYDVGSVGDQLFVAMELVDGDSLARWLVRHGRDRALAACIAAGRGLGAAHNAGLVHGDVKPDNILVDREGRAMIGDFGLARAIAGVDGEPDNRRRLCGTPAFMAPELFRGDPANVRSDQFAFAVTLYEAVSGARPWRGDSLEELRHAIGRVPPRRPRGMQAWLWALVARGLATDPSARHPSLAAFVDGLERGAARRRRRAWLVSGGAGVAVLGAGIVALTLRSSPGGLGVTCPDPSERTAGMARANAALCGANPSPACTALATALDQRVAAWRTTHVEVCRATREGRQSAELLDRRMRCLDQRLIEHDAFVSRLAGAPLDDTAAFGALGALGRLDAPASCATFDRPGLYARPPDDHAPAIAEAERWLAAAEADYALGRYPAGLAGLAPQFDAIRELAYPPLVARTAKALGQLQRQVGALAAAEKTFDVGLRAAAEARDDETTAELLLDLAYLIGESRQEPARGGELLRAAEAAIVRAGNLPALESSYLITRAGFAEQRGDFPAAVADLTRAVDVRRRSLGPDAGETAVALQRLCAAEGRTAQLDQARKHCEEAVDTMRRALGAQHPLVAEAEATLGVALAIQGNLTAARAKWESALTALEHALGPRSADLVPLLLNLGDVAALLKDAAAADRYLGRAIEITGQDKQDANNLALRVRVARQLERKQPAAALAMLEDVVRRAEAQLGRDHPTTASALAELAASYYNADRLADARASFERAIAAHRAIYGERHAATLSLEGRYGQTLFELKDPRAARAVYERVMLALEVTVAADSPVLAQAYSNFADAMLELHEPGAAVYATKGFAIRDKLADDPLQLAEARFILGEALWRDGTDRKRAVALVQQARDELRKLGPDAGSLPKVERWLAGRR